MADEEKRVKETSVTNNHSHKFKIDKFGNGATTKVEDHIHEIKNFKVMKTHNHIHTLPKEKLAQHKKKKKSKETYSKDSLEEENKMKKKEQLEEATPTPEDSKEEETPTEEPKADEEPKEEVKEESASEESEEKEVKEEPKDEKSEEPKEEEKVEETPAEESVSKEAPAEEAPKEEAHTEEKKEELSKDIEKTKKELGVIKEVREELSVLYVQNKELETKKEELSKEIEDLKKSNDSFKEQLGSYKEAEDRINIKKKQERLERLSKKFKVLGQDKTVEQLSKKDEETLSEFEKIVDAAISKTADVTEEVSEVSPSQGTAETPVEKSTSEEKKVEKAPVDSKDTFFKGILDNMTKEQVGNKVNGRALYM